MELLILRHGKAEDWHSGGDFSRALVEKGYAQSRAAAAAVQAAGILPEIVLTSPLVRARQTAETFCQTAQLPDPVVMDWIACGMSPGRALKELAAFRDRKRVAIVGHEPDLSELIASCLGATPGSIEVKKGAIACLRMDPPSPSGGLSFLLPPKLIAAAIS